MSTTNSNTGVSKVWPLGQIVPQSRSTWTAVLPVHAACVCHSMAHCMQYAEPVWHSLNRARGCSGVCSACSACAEFVQHAGSGLDQAYRWATHARSSTQSWSGLGATCNALCHARLEPMCSTYNAWGHSTWCPHWASPACWIWDQSTLGTQTIPVYQIQCIG